MNDFMDPFTVMLVVTIATVTAFWPAIVDFFSTKIVPFVRTKISPDIAELLLDFICWLDKPVSRLRKECKVAYKKFKETVLGYRSQYTKNGSSSVTKATMVILKKEDGSKVAMQKEEEVDWADLPDSVRSEMTRQQKKAAMFDEREAIDTKTREKAREMGMLEMLEN